MTLIETSCRENLAKSKLRRSRILEVPRLKHIAASFTSQERTLNNTNCENNTINNVLAHTTLFFIHISHAKTILPV